jgi:ornithine carbamoyltransferase
MSLEIDAALNASDGEVSGLFFADADRHRAMSRLKSRSVLTIDDLSGPEIEGLIDRAIEIKVAPRRMGLRGRHIGLIFVSPSLRTRSAFSIAASNEGACPQVFSKSAVRFGTGESIEDLAGVMSRMFDAVAIRAGRTVDLSTFAATASIPVINAMTDEDHPTQILADLMTLKEEGFSLAGTKVAFVGHGHGNVCRSLMMAASKVGLDLAVVTPEGVEPPEAFVDALNAAPDRHPDAMIWTTSDPKEGVLGAAAIYADMWINTNVECDVLEVVRPFQDYRITEALMASSGSPRTIFLHCLPSLHNLETELARRYPQAIDTEDAVFKGRQSRVLPQAENRVHTIQALMAAVIG